MRRSVSVLALILSADAACAQTVVLEKPKAHGGFPCYAFSPDGEFVAGGTGVVMMTIDGRKRGTDGGEVLLWNAKTGKIHKTLGKHEASVRWLAWSADGTVLASGSLDDGVVKAWDARSGALRATLKGPGPLGKSGTGAHVLCALTPDGHTLAMVTVTNSKVGASEVRTGDTLTLWDVRSGRPRWQLPDSQVAALAFSPDGKTLAASAVKVDWKESDGGATGTHVDRRLIAWETASGQERWRAPVRRVSPDSLAFVPGAGLLAIHDSRFTSIDVATGAAGAEIRGQRQRQAPEHHLFARWRAVRRKPVHGRLHRVGPDGHGSDHCGAGIQARPV